MRSEKPTVVVVAPYFPPYGGGLERYAYEIARGLEKNCNWRVVVITSGERWGTDNKEEVNGMTIYRLAYRWKFSNTPFSFGWIRKIKKILKEEHPDILNIHEPVPGIGDIASFLAPDKPIVLTYHAVSMRKGRLLPDLFVWLYEHGPLNILLRRANLIICSSDFVRFEFLNSYTQKSRTITPAVDSNFFKPLENNSASAKHPTVLFVASLNRAEQYKGLKYLIDGIKIVKETVPDIRLVVVGDGDMKGSYEAHANRLGLHDSVKFEGRLSGGALVKQYERADIFSLPSLNESFGMVILEAMSAGLPIVATNVGGIPTLVDEGKNGFLVEPRSAAALAEKIEYLIAHPAEAAALGAAGRTKAIEHFDWERRVAEYDRINRSLSGSKTVTHTAGAVAPHADKELVVIVLTYNSSSTIRFTLDSLVHQTNQNFSVLIVDDDSTDSTLKVIDEYKAHSGLKINVVRNGSHNISRGRNIGIMSSPSDLVAFLDSDDSADPRWVDTIIKTFNEHPDAAILSGTILTTGRTATGKAIATNDGTARQFFGKGILLFCTANSAFNKGVLKSERFFDEDFTYAEDLEIASRIQKRYTWIFVPDMKVYQNSRNTLREYASQMYRYGIWKVYYGYVAKDFRFIDFVPLIIILLSIIGCFVVGSWWPIVALIGFSLLESLFVVIAKSKGLFVSFLTFPAWLVKNYAWTLGVIVGLFTLLSEKTLRTRFIQKRT